MFQHSIGPQVLIHLAEVCFLLWVPSRARNTRLAIDHDERVRADRAGRIERGERYDDRCCITTWVCHQLRVSYPVAEEFSKAIDRFLQQFWRSVLETVPLGIKTRV